MNVSDTVTWMKLKGIRRTGYNSHTHTQTTKHDRKTKLLWKRSYGHTGDIYRGGMASTHNIAQSIIIMCCG